MQLTGAFAFTAEHNQLWHLLNDPIVLARAIPGIQQLRQQAEDHYDVDMLIKMGPVNGPMTGIMRVTDKIALERYQLHIDAEGHLGVVTAWGVISLQRVEVGTHVHFNGEAQIAGKLARMGQRMLTSVARQYTKQFFKAIAKEIPGHSAPKKIKL